MNNPTIRFKEFVDDYQPKKIGDVLTERNEKSTITKELPQLSFTIQEGVIDPESKKTNKRDFLIKDKENKKFLVTRLNDIIYNPANVKFGAIHKNSLKDGVVSPIYKIFKVDGDSAYFDVLFSRKTFINKITRLTEGTVEKLKTLNPEYFLRNEILVPTLKEQQKVATLFEKINSMIISCDKEIISLQQQKKSLSKKIFNQEIRFKDENGNDYPEWEEKIISELCDEVTAGNTAPQDDCYFDENSNHNFVRVYDMGILGDKNYIYDTRDHLSDTGCEKLKLFPKGSILFTKSGASLLQNQRAILSKPMYVVSHIGVLIPKKECVSEWLYYAMCEIDFKSFATGTSLPAITLSLVNEIRMFVPAYSEQQKIASVLSAYDELIETKQKQLDNLKNIRKGFLQQMFPKEDK